MASKSGTKKASTKKAATKKAPAKKAASKKAPAKKAPPAAKTVVIGVLTDEGVECRAMRQDRTRKLFTLVPRSKLTGFKTGERVRVTGTIQQFSICQQGTTIAISTIVRVK